MRVMMLVFVGLAFFGVQGQDQGQWSDQLNTGQAVNYMTDLEKTVLLELNKVRSDPERYARLYIEPMLKQFDGNLYKPGRIRTKEGVSAVEECIAQLKKAKKAGVLNPDTRLEKTSTRHTDAQSKTNQVGHTSPNGDTFQDRVRQYRFQLAGECISYGVQTPQAIVCALLIDDGVADRGHRKIIIDPRFQIVGIAVGTHLVFRRMCTVDFAR